VLRIAYLVGRYPGVSHTFIQREVVALRSLGVDVSTFSVWRTDPQELLSEGDRREYERTQVLLPPRLPAALAGHVRAAEMPRGYASLIGHALRLGPPGVRRLLLGGSWIVEAVSLWDALRRTGIRHIHAHLNGTAPTVAMLAAELGNVAEPDSARRWTWSFTVHGPSEFADVVRERLRAKIEAASFVVAISDFARSQLMSLVDESRWSKLHVVHCGVDPNVFVPVPDGAVPQREDGVLNILSVGRLSAAKGHGVLLEAVARVAGEGVPVHVTLVGDGPRRAELERRAESLGIRHRVTFSGAVGQDELPGYFAAADVFCLASFAEGLPVVLMEAMATGTPVVTTAVMGIPELVVNGEHGLVVRPGRPDLIASAIRRLAADAELRQRLGQAARARVADEFDVHREAARLRDLFLEYAGTPVATGGRA
jgi:colanic acid/amylovoran biosynthesis glycosyltransferase